MAWSTEEIAQLDLDLCREILREGEAKLFDTLDSTVTPNVGTGTEEINRCWVEGVADKWSMLRRFLEIYVSAKNTNPADTVTDPMASMEVHKGLYRQAFIRRLQRNGTTYIVQTLRRGLMRELMEDEGRVVQEGRASGNDSSATGVSNTTSHDPDGFCTVRFSGVDPEFREAVVAQALQHSWAASEVARYGLSEDWKAISVSCQETDDGTLNLDLLLARPQFTLRAYQKAGTADQYDVIYVWNVPKVLAQDILDAWKVGGIDRSATCSFNTDQRLVDIVLSKRTTLGITLPGLSIKQSCDTTITTFYGFGLSETDAQAFFDANKPLSSPAGQSASGRISSRGDGLFDVVIVIGLTTFDEDTHILRVGTFKGFEYERERVYFYFVPKEKLEDDPDNYLDELLAEYYTAASEALFVTTDANVTRNDNCTFDCVFDILRISPGNTAWLPVYNDGIIVRHVKRFWNQVTAPSVTYVSADDDITGYTPVGGDPYVYAGTGAEPHPVKIEIQNHSVVNGALHSYDRIRTYLAKCLHVVAADAQILADDKIIKSWITGTSEAPTIMAWNMRRSRPLTLKVTRRYAFVPGDSNYPAHPVATLTPNVDGDGIADLYVVGRSAGFDAARDLHYQDTSETKTTTWSVPVIHKIGDTSPPYWPTPPPWNSGSGGWGSFP